MMRSHPRFTRVLLPALPLLVLSGFCFARLIVQPGGLIVDGGRASIDYANRGDPRPVGNDLVFLFLPHHWSIGRRISEFGHWPVWDARGFGGRPLIGNPQGGMFYPPVWIAWVLQAPAALGWLTVGHLIWGGLGVYVLARGMRQGRWAATVAAGVYQASPLLLAHTFEGHYPHVWAVSWYPWAFWAFRDCRKGRARGRLLLPPILTLTYLTGHPQEWLLLVLALSVWILGDLGSWVWNSGLDRVRKRAARPALPTPSRGWNSPSRRLVCWLGILVLSMGMAAVDLVPQVMMRPWLRQNHDSHLEPGIPRRYHLGGMNLFQLLSPSALGGPSDYFGDDNYWESVYSMGLTGLVLAAVAVARHPDHRQVRGWLILASLAIAFACGRSLGLYPLIYSTVPGMAGFRVPARSLFLANLAAAVLAGLGVQTLQVRMADRDSWRRFARRFGVAVVIVVGALFLVQSGRLHRADAEKLRGRYAASRMEQVRTRASVSAPAAPPASRRTAMASARILQDGTFWFAIAGLAVLVILGCQPVGERDRRRLGGLLGLVAMIELGWSGFSLIRVAPAEPFAGPEAIRINRVVSHPTQCRSRGELPARIKARDAFFGDLPAAVRGIEKTNVDDAFQLDHAAVLYEMLYPVASHIRPMTERLLSPSAKDAWRRIRRAVFDRMSVTHIVSDRFEEDPGWPVTGQGPWNGSQFVIQRNPTAMPRAYVVPCATVLPEHPGVVLTSFLDLDPHATVVMGADPLASLPPGPRQPLTPAVWRSTDPDRPALQVKTEAPGLLVVADTWMPGWTATVDGRAVPVLRGNLAQRVIPLPDAGSHEVVLEYRPPGLIAGCTLTVLSLVVGVAMTGRFGGRMLRSSGSIKAAPSRTGPCSGSKSSRRVGQWS